MRGPALLQSQRGSPRPVLAFLLAVLWSMMAAPVMAQNNAGQVANLNITNPDPTATRTNPLRTSRDFFVIEYSHDGASGSYFVSTDGADIEGSSFDGGNPGQTNTEVAAGFDTDGVKDINIILFQTRFNATFQTTNPARIQFDSTPPDFTLQRLVLNPDEAARQFSSGETLFTSSSQLTIEGTVQDPDAGSPSQEIQFDADVGGVQTTFQGNPDNAGTFSSAIDLGTADGEKTVSLTAQDSFPDDPAALPNISTPFVFRIVLDTLPAAILDVTIIRDPDDAVRRQELPATGQTFVGRNQIRIRVEFSEPLRSQPTLAVTQTNGAGIIATPLANLAVENRIFTWAYTPNPPDDQNGPAQVTISGVFDRAGNETTGDPLQDITAAFTVDTIPPVRVRFPAPAAGDVVSVPGDGDLVGKNDFPEVIQVFVDDYDTRDQTAVTKDNASGVLFDQITRGPPDTTGTTRSLTIQLLEPGGSEVPGTASISPPFGIFLNLPDFTDPGAGIPGFVDSDQDGVAEPVEGTWRIVVGLFDEVGNTNTETYLFTVDTTPIQGSTIVVQVANATPNPNPLVRGTASCWGGPTMLQSSVDPTITVSSTDPTFSTTRSRVQFLSKVGGANSQPVLFDATTTRSPTEIVLNGLREPLQPQATDDFPVTEPPPGSNSLSAGTLDPRLGQSDGIYLVRVFPVDTAGNERVLEGSRQNVRDFVEFELNLDTVQPYTTRTFPVGNSSINEGLRIVDAIVVDPASPNGNEGCGVDVDNSSLTWTLEAAYRPSQVDLSLIDDSAASLPFAGPAPLRGVVRFVHLPNNTDPTLASFNANDDSFRVLLELTDTNGFVRSLPIDGSMDGVYSITSVPQDGAGNRMDANADANGRSNYIGLSSSNETTRDIIKFFFLYDTINPEVTVTNLEDEAFLGGPQITLTGEVVDHSAQDTLFSSPGDRTQGGSGVDRVEVLLEAVDVNGNPIPGIPASSSTTSDDSSIIIPARNNPVIPATAADIAAIENESNDPTRSVTNPLTAEFATTQRERRVWKAVLDLPSQERLLPLRDNQPGDFYRLTVRAFDRAGNSTEIRRRVTLSLDYLRAPQLEEPPCGMHTNVSVQTFEWTAVQGATRYRFELQDPNGSTLTRTLVSPITQVNLTLEGDYRWRVASMDGAGNLGAFSTWCLFDLDRTRPKVVSVQHQDPVEPNPNSGSLNTGKVIFTVQFSEDLLASAGVGVQLDPLGGVGASPMTVTTLTLEGSLWTGEVTIPNDANPADWDGNANLLVAGASDAAGNVMLEDRTRTVEIDTGPFFLTRFFLSPMNDNEITVAILASEDLHEPPSISNLQGASLIDFLGTGTSTQARPVAGSPRASFLTMRLGSTGNSQVAFDLTGQDLSLNGAKRSVSFDVIRPTGTAQSAVTRSGLRIYMDAEATSGKPLYLFPPVSQGSEGQDLRAVANALVAEEGGQASSELVELAFPEGLSSPGAVAGTLEVEVPVASYLQGRSDVAPGQVGLYALENGRWRLLGSADEEGAVRAQLSSLQPLLVAADPVAPRIEVLSHSNGVQLDRADPEVVWSLADDGSGVDPASIQVLLDETVVPHAYDATRQELRLALESPLPPGTHRLEVEAQDLSGNSTRSATLFLTAPNGFGFSDPPMAVPNPARVNTSIRYDLTQPGTTRSVTCEIFDAAGRRIRVLEASGAFQARNNLLRWDLRTRRGRRVRNGVYLFRIRARGATESVVSRGKIAVLR